MREKLDNSTPITRNRRPGQRMGKDEREATQEKFLKALSMTANIRAACMAAGIDRSLVYYWQEHDDSFSMRFNIANQEANDLLFAAAWERSVKGVEKPVVSMGKQVFVDGKPLMERVYSDALLSLLLKARLPEFRDRQQVDVNANLTGSVQTSDLSSDLRLLTNEQLAQFKTWLQEAKAGQEQ